MTVLIRNHFILIKIDAIAKEYLNITADGNLLERSILDIY